MYTQCPQCKVAFKVTPQVLQQAGGKVRCGSCQGAFNALDHLSDSAPQNAATASGKTADAANQLVGTDDRTIEETGVQWRAVDGGASTARNEAGNDDGLPGDVGYAATIVEEPRFDDNTPISEDFFDQRPEPSPQEPPLRRATDRLPPDFSKDNEDQDELELSEPGEWIEVLDEVEELVLSSDEPDEEASAVLDAIAINADDDDDDDDDELILDDEADDSDDSSLSEADVSAAMEALELDTGEPDDEIELADDAGNDDAGVSDADVSAAMEALVLDGDDEDADIELDDDVEPASEADVSAALETLKLEADDGDDEIELDGESAASDDDSDSINDDLSAAIDQLERALQEQEEAPAEAESPAGEADPAAADVDEDSGPTDEREDPAETLEVEDDEDDASSKRRLEENILAMTANMEVDPEVLMAMRDGDLGVGKDGSPMVESVIMEGSSVRDFIEQEVEKESRLKGSDEPTSLLDTYMLNRNKTGNSEVGTGGRTISIVLLTLSLLVQVVHSQRHNLAMMSFFDGSLGVLYESAGSPVVPNWDARGWQFESTSGSTGEDEQLLTITSRISNRSGRSLPYPLIHVALTDRYEEVVGSRVLQPRDYVPRGTNPNRPIPAGQNFTAEVAFNAASADATGFKLNVCYPTAGDAVRCAIEDFK